MLDARQIANEVLLRAWEMNKEVTQLEMNKIVYFLHGHHLRDHGEPLIKGEFEAWDYGPVHTALRSAFRDYGRSNIIELAKKFNPVSGTYSEFPKIADNMALGTINSHLHKYLAMTSTDLVNLSHSKGSPWSKTIESSKVSINLGMKISNSTILNDFEGI